MCIKATTITQKVEVYVNELLSYLWHYYKSSSKVTIRRVIEEKFSREDIKKAKKLLSDLGVDMEKADGRATSNNRSALEADVSDLMNGLESLDKNEELDSIFAAVVYGKISMTITPEEAWSSRMMKVETMLAILRKDME